MAMYEIILRSPNGIMESKGIFSEEQTIRECDIIRKTLSAKYGSKVASHFRIHVCGINTKED